MDWNDPAQRARLLDQVGHDEYHRQFGAWQKGNTLEMVGGHALRPVQTRFGRLIQVGSTGKAFSTMEQAKAYAEANPA